MKRLEQQSVSSAAVIVGLLFCCSVVSASQDEGDRIIAQADALFEEGEFNEARELYVHFVENYPGRPAAARAAIAIGRCFLEEDQITEAVMAFESAVDRFGDSPHAASAYHQLGRAKLRQGYIQDALDYFNSALRKSPSREILAGLYGDLAGTYYQLKSYGEAAKFFAHYLGYVTDGDEMSGVSLKLAECYYHIGDYAGAKALLAVEFEKNPDLLTAEDMMIFRWGECLLFTGDYDRARVVFSQHLALYPGTEVEAHLAMRLGDVDRLQALASDDTSERRELLRSAIRHYMNLLGESQFVDLSYAAAVRIVQSADLGEIDTEEEFALGSGEEILEEALGEAEQPGTRALILLHLARHHLLKGNELKALETYSEIVRKHWELELATAVRGEYSQVSHEMMQAAYDRGDFLRVCIIHLNHGQELKLSGTERVQLAESYMRVQLNSQARELFNRILQYEDDRDLQRQAALGLARIEVQVKNFESAVKSLKAILDQNPPPEEAEETMLLLLDSLASLHDIESLSLYWYERTSELTTPQTKATCLFLLSMLTYNNRDYRESADLFRRFIAEFGQGIAGSYRVYSYIRDTYRILGDLYFIDEEWKRAAGQYGLYIALYGNSQDIAWPLYQSAKCRLELKDNSVAREIFQALVRLYPDSPWSREARVILNNLEESS